MATTPFTTTTVSSPGVALPRDRNFAPLTKGFWLGKAGNMIQLPAPSIGYGAGHTRAETQHALIGGGITVTKRLHAKRTWPMNWKRVQNRDLQVLLGFYRGAFGDGPFVLIDPADDNYLSLDSSLCGARNGAIGAWTVKSPETLVYDSTITSPVLPCGVLRWHGAGNGSTIAVAPRDGSGNVIASTTESVPLIQAMAQQLSVYAWTASSVANAQLGLNDGVAATAFSGTVGLTTTPQRLTFNHAAGAFGSNLYAMLVVKCLTASAPDIFVSAPQFEYGVATASQFAAGSNAPRVVVSGPPGNSVDGLGASPFQLMLTQI